ncbi:unnamed protein product [Lupinus luteus]|uniref:xyloglucan:xyloglucosyl transferase n=1 Tax=Lupinus luteus TaxID=3873 RepID=A0AAV1XRV3_LUPLU
MRKHTIQQSYNIEEVTPYLPKCLIFVDNTPIRVYKNNQRLGVNYPTIPMFLEGTIWNGEAWASGGRKIDWSKAPFKMQYQGFKINGCESGNKKCDSEAWWNKRKYWDLTPREKTLYENVKKKFVYYDYCSDHSRSGKVHKECYLK